MIKTMIAEVLKERIRISVETQDNWDYGIEQCWKKYIDIFSKDIGESMDYFLNECSDEEFYGFLRCLKNLSKKLRAKSLFKFCVTALQKSCPKIIISKIFNQNI